VKFSLPAIKINQDNIHNSKIDDLMFSVKHHYDFIANVIMIFYTILFFDSFQNEFSDFLYQIHQ